MGWTWLSPLTLGCLVATGCESKSSPAPDKEPASASEQTASSWRYGEAMAEALPDTPFRIVVELSRGGQGLAWVVAATMSDGAPALKVWTFEQQEKDVAPHGDPKPLTRARPGEPAPPMHGEFRRNLAAPGAVVRRPVGLPAKDARALVDELAGLARNATDASRSNDDRVAAFARLVQGVDDAVVFERDGLAQLVAVLADPKLATGEPTAQSERRASVPVTVGEAPRLAQVWAKGEGWTLVDLDPAPQ